jgi:hypothetical protein
MNWPFSQRIKPLLRIFKNRKRKEKGAVTLISAFMIFIFTTLGLTTLILTQINLKLSDYRKNSSLLDYASENGIKQGFAHLLDHLSTIKEPIVISEENFFTLNQEASNKGEELIAYLFSSEIPLTIEDSWEYMKWKCQTSFSKIQFKEYDAYFTSEYEVRLSSHGKIYEYNASRTKVLSCTMQIFAGHIPLLTLPLLKDNNTNYAQNKDFLEKNNISVFTSPENKLIPETYLSEEELIPDQSSEQIKEALNIKTFKPQDLSDTKLRQILGLEIVNEPVPEGVFLIKDDLGLGGMFIQGDVEEMIFAVERNFQVIKISLESGIWILKFDPIKYETNFLSPSKQESYNLTPKGLIIVNGGIKSLRGGKVSASGEIKKLEQGEQSPSILRSVNLTIITSNEITITDHLIHEGVKWIDSVPYIKDSHSQLNIFAGGNNLIEKEKRTGGITLESSASEELTIQASLTTSNGEFSVKGENKIINILGSVHGSKYNTHGNKLNIWTDNRFLTEDNQFENSPKTKNPILSIAQFEIRDWKENE